MGKETVGGPGPPGLLLRPTPSAPTPRKLLTACSFSVSSRRRFRHLAAASLFLSLRIRRFSSSSGDS